MENTTKDKTEKTKIDYSISFKRWIAREVESGRITSKEAIEKHNINRDTRTIYDWVQLYGIEKELSLTTMTPQERQDKAALEKRIKELEKALEYAKFKNIAIETMIDIAEEQFKIPIRKKSGPKQ